MNFSFNYNEKIYTKENFKENENGYSLLLESGVSVTAVCKEYREYDAKEWVLRFENKGSSNSGIFSDINDCDINYIFKNPEERHLGYMPGKNFPCITKMYGMLERQNGYYAKNDKGSAGEFSTEDIYIFDDAVEEFQNVGARSSDELMPFFDIHTEKSGIIMAIGWTGGWRVKCARTGDCVNIKSGLKHTNFYLEPGEKIRTSSVVIMEYDHEDKYNKFRRLVKEYFSHKSYSEASRDGLLAFELWGSLPSDIMVKRLNELKKYDIRFEDIWIDAGWYGAEPDGENPHDGGWENQTGNWSVDKSSHPDEFCDVRDAAKAIGANLMLWFEPERAVKGTPVTLKHPEWFLTSSENEIDWLINYGVEDALMYVFDTLCKYIDILEFSCYRQDFNRCPEIYFKEKDKPFREGITEIKHIMGMYRLWDMLLEKYPHLIIDNCSAGGRRIDIETIRRSIPFFRTDYLCALNGNAEVLQVHNSGISKYIPFNGATTKVTKDIYTLRSSYSSSWGTACYNTIDRQLGDDDFEYLKFAVDEYNSIRKYFSCDFYNYASEMFDDTSWAIWQYHDAESGEGIVLAFRRSNSPFDTVTIALCGVNDEDTISYHNVDTGETFEANTTLEIILPEKRSCVLIKYKTV